MFPLNEFLHHVAGGRMPVDDSATDLPPTTPPANPFDPGPPLRRTNG